MEFRHPKHYAELRKIYKQAEKLKQPAIEETVPLNEIEEATSEHQAPSANELDKDPGLGYYGINKTKPPLKVSSIRAVSKAGSFRAISRQSRDVSLHKSSPGAVHLPSCEFSNYKHKPQSTSEQSLKHRGPRSTSNGRASKTFP